MLMLENPITLGANTYRVIIGGIKGEWDLRARRLEVTLALAREKGGKTIIATREKEGEKTRVLSPPIVATISISDAIPPDPAYAAIFQKLHELTEAIEVVLVADGSLEAYPYQAGEEEVLLACAFASGSPLEIEEKEKTPKAPKAPKAPKGQ